MKLSVVVPAYNEEKLLGGTLAAIRNGLESCPDAGLEWELIVADNNSTDATARVALEAGAVVVFEGRNQIARARNRGGARAGGEWLLFVDADSRPSPALMARAVEVMERRPAVGGGSTVAMPGAPRLERRLVSLWNGLSVACRWAAGSFLFCRRDAFCAVGGFDESLYASEEIDLSRKLKRYGRPRGLEFVILRGRPLETSARKLELYTKGELLRFLWRYLRNPRGTLRRREDLDIWYDGRR